MNGTYLLGCFAFIALLFVWAWRDRISQHRDDVETRHARVRRGLAVCDRIQERQYRDGLRFEIEVAELLAAA